MIVHVISVKACRDYTERSGQCICWWDYTSCRICIPVTSTNLPQYVSDNIEVTQKGIKMYFSWIGLRGNT